MESNEVERLIDEVGADIYRFCIKLCGNKYDSEDLYQQTFLKLLEIEVEINWDDNPKALLFSIAYRLWKDKLRKFARRQKIAPSFMLDENTENLVKDNYDIEQDVLTQQLKNDLNKIIEALPEKFRVPIVLHYQFETPLEEVAQIIKIPKGTVKSRLDKARKLIRKGLEEKGYEYP